MIKLACIITIYVCLDTYILMLDNYYGAITLNWETLPLWSKGGAKITQKSKIKTLPIKFL